MVVSRSFCPTEGAVLQGMWGFDVVIIFKMVDVLFLF